MKRKSANNLVVYCLLLLSAMCSGCTTKKSSSDSIYRSNLVGTWIIDGKNINFTYVGEATLSEDGTFTSYALQIRKKDNLQRQAQFSGKWEVKNGFLIETITKSNLADWANQVTKDKIIKVDKKEFQFQYDDGRTEVRKRKIN